jgi:hypothetical protein
VRVKLGLKIVALKLDVAPFADGDGWRAWFHYSQFALHGFSLAHSRRKAIDLWKSNGTITNFQINYAD